MNVAGVNILSSVSYGTQTSIKSVSKADPAIQFLWMILLWQHLVVAQLELVQTMNRIHYF